MVKQTAVPQIKSNKVTQAQYDAMEKNPNEFYMVTDAKISYDDLSDKPIETYSGGVVSAPTWVESTTYPEYPYQADLPILGISVNDIPTVNFALSDAISGNYAPVAESFEGFIRIYAKAIPETPTKITSIVCQRITNS